MLQLIANLDYIELWEASKATLLMLSMALILIVLLGLPLGVAIYSFANSRIRKHPFLYQYYTFYSFYYFNDFTDAIDGFYNGYND